MCLLVQRRSFGDSPSLVSSQLSRFSLWLVRPSFVPRAEPLVVQLQCGDSAAVQYTAARSQIDYAPSNNTRNDDNPHTTITQTDRQQRRRALTAATAVS